MAESLQMEHFLQLREIKYFKLINMVLLQDLIL